MKDETKLWLDYAKENLLSAQILLESSLYNTVLQNTQQSIEKDLKALFVEKGIKLQKTHSISSLVETLKISNELNLDPRDATLFYAEWWRRKYNGGKPSKEFIFKSIGNISPILYCCLSCITNSTRGSSN